MPLELRHCHNRSIFSVHYGIIDKLVVDVSSTSEVIPADVIIIVILVKYSMYRKVFNV